MAPLFELLGERRIRLRSLQSGHQEHIDCPFCGGGDRRDRRTLSVKIDADGDGATWVCHRGTCAVTGGVRTTPDNPRHQRRPQEKAAPRPPAELTLERPEWFWEFWTDRHIGKATLDHLGIHATPKFFFQGIGERPAIVFPYTWDGKLHRRKLRPHPDKSPQSQVKVDDVATLFNADAVEVAIATGVPLIWVEGEPDVAAIYEATGAPVVSLRDGAPMEAKFRDDDARFDALKTHAERLHEVQSHILAGDMDKPGMALREELARRLGLHRVRLVTWPAGCKDACDTIRLEGHGQAVIAAIEAAVPYPIDGLEDFGGDSLEKLYAAEPPPLMSTGVVATDNVLRLPTDGKLLVVTGVPSHGKSSWLRFLAAHTIRQHKRKWLVFAAEDDLGYYRISLAEIVTGKQFRGDMTQADRATATAILGGSIRFLKSDGEAKPPTVDWLLERAIFSVLRDGTTDVLLDPWNEVEHQRGDLNETDYISRALQRFRTFAHRYRCNVWVIAHPAKPPPLKAGEKRRPPRGYEISGSANWANKCDLGLTVWSEKPGTAQVIIWKSRWHRWGVIGTHASLDFSQATGRYLDPIKTGPEPEPDPRFQDD